VRADDRLLAVELHPPNRGDAVKGIKVGEKVTITDGRHKGRGGICEGERRGKVLVRLDANGTNTARPTVPFQPEQVCRAMVQE
jgi:hypothetical protein